MYKWQNASYIIHGDTSCSHWPAVEDKCDISPDQDFISANSAATCSTFCFPICRYSLYKEWERRNLNFKIALDLAHVTAEPLTDGDEIVNAAINK